MALCCGKEVFMCDISCAGFPPGGIMNPLPGLYRLSDNYLQLMTEK
jgi:hypothetical protein